jgi:hypothetical protein
VVKETRTHKEKNMKNEYISYRLRCGVVVVKKSGRLLRVEDGRGKVVAKQLLLFKGVKNGK